MQPRLTIAIPTYRRATQVGLQLARIVPQLTEDVEVLISENGRTDATVAAVAPFLSDRVRYQSSKVNRGFTGNFMSCVEAAQSEWLWILGDDDPVHNDAVNRIIGWISSTSADIVTTRTYSTPTGESNDVRSVEALFSAITLSEALSISASVWRRGVLEQHAHAVLVGAYSMQPQLAVMIKWLETQSGTVLVIGDRLVDQSGLDPKQGWSKLQYIERCWTLITLVEHRTEVARALWSNWQWAFVQSLDTLTNERQIEDWRTATLTSLQFFSAYIPREVHQWWRMQFRAYAKRTMLRFLQRSGRRSPVDLLFSTVNMIGRSPRLNNYCAQDFQVEVHPDAW